MKRAYSSESIRKAEEELAQAAADDNPHVAARQTVKAGQIISYWQDDPGGKSHIRLLLAQFTVAQSRVVEWSRGEKSLS